MYPETKNVDDYRKETMYRTAVALKWIKLRGEINQIYTHAMLRHI